MRIVKIVIALCVYTLDLIRRGLGLDRRGTCVALCYHGVPRHLRERFARQMAMAARYTTPVAANSEIELEPGRRYCMVTFDDGLWTYKDCALPEMEKHAIPSTNFVPMGYLGGACTWMRPEVIPLSPRD